jgi:DNA primase
LPGDFAYSVKQQADIVRIVGEYVKLKKTGGQNFTGLCPFHQEKTPSFSVHATRQFYHCFGCGESGDVFKFIQKTENLTFPEAVRFVAQKLGIALPKTTYSSEAEAQQARMRGALLEIHERACLWFQERLRSPEAAHARSYLAGRGLNAKTTGDFRMGYAPDSGFLLREALRRDYDEELLRASGLFSWKEQAPAAGRPPSAEEQPAPGDPPIPPPPAGPPAGDPRLAALYSRFRNRIMFPIANEAGRIIAFTGRILGGEGDQKQGPKYLNSPETPIYSKSHVLFNLDKAKESIRQRNYSILVEGQMDCISVFGAGIPNVIASSGTAFTEAQARLLSRFSKNIVVNFDPDAAGAAAAERSLAMLVEQEFQIRVVSLEQGYDPDLYLRRAGVEAYTAALKSAPRYFDFLIERARKNFPRSADGKVKALNFLVPHIQRIPSRIVRDELCNEIAHRLSIDSGVLRQELKHAAVARGAQQVSAPVRRSGDSLPQIEERLIRALYGDSAPELRQAVIEELGADRECLQGLLTESLILKLVAGEPLEMTDSEAGYLALALMPNRQQESHYRESLSAEAVRRDVSFLRTKPKLESERQAISAEILKRQNAGEPLADLLLRKQEVDRALRDLDDSRR